MLKNRTIVPRYVNFDIDAMRSFALAMELGSFARAAERVGRSTSAVSAQLKKLEQQAGTALVHKAGRHLVLTEAGVTVLGYANRLLALNDEAALALSCGVLDGTVHLGLQEDFSETLLAGVLGQFACLHPMVRVQATVGRNSSLLEQVHGGQLDLALIWHCGDVEASATLLDTQPMRWIGRGDASDAWVDKGEPLPLVALDTPCAMRTFATDALDAAGIAWRVAFTSASLGSIWAAVAAGLGVAARPVCGMPGHLAPLPSGAAGLPQLPVIGRAVVFAPGLRSAACARMAQVITQHVLGGR